MLRSPSASRITMIDMTKERPNSGDAIPEVSPIRVVIEVTNAACAEGNPPYAVSNSLVVMFPFRSSVASLSVCATPSIIRGMSMKR